MEGDPEPLDGGREDRLGAKKGLKTTSGVVVRDMEQLSGRQTTEKGQPASQPDRHTAVKDSQ